MVVSKEFQETINILDDHWDVMRDELLSHIPSEVMEDRQNGDPRDLIRAARIGYFLGRARAPGEFLKFLQEIRD